MGNGVHPWTTAKQTFWQGVARAYTKHYGADPRFVETEPVAHLAHYLIGESGFPNYGDELITREWVKYLAQIDPDSPVVLDCVCSGPSAAILYGLHPNLSVVDTIAQLCIVDRDALWHEEFDAPATQIEEIPAARIAQRMEMQLDDEGQAPRYAAGIRLLNTRIRDLHIIGGGYMNSRWNANLARLAGAAWAQRHGKPAMVTGIGLEPLESQDIDFVRNTARNIASFSCRDVRSRDAIDSGHEYTFLAPDDCFVNGLEGVYTSEEAALPDVMVCVQLDLVADPQALIRHVIHVLDSWGVSTGTRIGVVECIPRDSVQAMGELHKHGFEPVLFALQDMLDSGFPARAGQRWISTRCHPHLLAAARGCSGIFIPVKPGYYDVKHEAVLRMGSRWTCTAIGDRQIPAPGPGFADPSMRFIYRDQIRAQVAPWYGATS